MLKKYVEKIENTSVYDVAIKTPLDVMPTLSKRLNNEVLLKREDLQPVFSFKLRGAYNKIASLSEESRNKGVIAASAGNHAQGVALVAQKLGIDALIVMPVTTPAIKVNSVREKGAQIILHGDAYDEAYEHAKQVAIEQGLTFVHPYDDEDVIAGQGTVAMEVLQQASQLIDAIFVPVGGGGLIAGVAAYFKAKSPSTKVIGVEPEDAACMHHALAAGERVVLDQVGIFADGVAVRQVGAEPFHVAQHYVDEVILVSTDEICAAIKDIFDDTRSIAEPAGALAVAGLKKYIAREKCQHQQLVAIDSGANINFDRLQHVAERAEVGEQREALLAVTIPEQPGSFLTFCSRLGKRSITEFNYRYAHAHNAHIFVGVELSKGDKEKNALIARLANGNYEVVDMTDNEMAKMHIRHMVGGHAESIDNEVLFRFQFPERPGALLKFLTLIGLRWNISLFHYRNHGAAYGRVFVGLQVKPSEHIELIDFFEGLGYDYWEEVNNPAYQLFLAKEP
ncbi:MAG: threonine ammonia-lyase, biosynthetic [Thiotrichaceae bacterium]|nr:threonine ammonia-lyase, biosynthetic [Thiotrichaceae bacterium]PCI10265.1 MAG: threonine ammonia-lyase, biosynthetic [Thiotrichales bacterium]PCI12228.1 MAG: threonine ammonia-lyase, biosynthetic [Thiotrichales bacterium]